MDDAGLDGVSWIIRFRVEAQTIAAVLFPGIFKEKCIGQDRDDAPDAFFIVVIFLAVTGLLGGRVEQMLKACLFQLASLSIERLAVAQLDPRDRSLGGL